MLQLREIAPEYYNTLSYHTSWTWVTMKFLTDPEVGPWTRMRRLTKGHDEGPAPVLSKPKDGFAAKTAYGVTLEEVRDSGVRSRAPATALIG